MNKLILIIIGLVIISSTAFAQKAKYGHLNANAILMKMTELKTADAQLKTYVQELESEITKMNKDYEDKLRDFKEKESTMSDIIKATKTDEINGMTERIKKFQISAQESVNAKREEIYKPVIDKFKAAIKDVAKENGFKMIFDSGQDVLLYYEDADDVTKLVEKKLGIN